MQRPEAGESTAGVRNGGTWGWRDQRCSWEVGGASSQRTLWAALNLWLYSEDVHVMGMVSPLTGSLGTRVPKFKFQLLILLGICN